MADIDPKFYDDAEMLALQIVRECAKENYSGARSEEMYAKVYDELLVPLIERHGGHGALGLVIAMGRLAANTWSAVLENRLGHFPTEDEILAELDSFEMHKLDQQQEDEEDL